MDRNLNACLECGKTEEWHNRQSLNPREEAEKFLLESKLKNHVLHDMFVNILEKFIVYKNDNK